MPLSKTNLETPRSLEPVRRHVVQASNVLVTINSAVNFIVYCMISRQFRGQLVRRCCRCTSTSSSSSLSLSRQHGDDSCCWRLGRWCRQRTGRDSWRQSETTDSKRSTTATNQSDPRSNVAPAVQLQPTKQLEPQQQQLQLVQMHVTASNNWREHWHTTPSIPDSSNELSKHADTTLSAQPLWLLHQIADLLSTSCVVEKPNCCTCACCLSTWTC